jgi:hypothetical protein
MNDAGSPALTGRTAARTDTHLPFPAVLTEYCRWSFPAVVRGGRVILFDEHYGEGGLGEGKCALSMPGRLSFPLFSVRLSRAVRSVAPWSVRELSPRI